VKDMPSQENIRKAEMAVESLRTIWPDHHTKTSAINACAASGLDFSDLNTLATFQKHFKNQAQSALASAALSNNHLDMGSLVKQALERVKSELAKSAQGTSAGNPAGGVGMKRTKAHRPAPLFKQEENTSTVNQPHQQYESFAPIKDPSTGSDGKDPSTQPAKSPIVRRPALQFNPEQLEASTNAGKGVFRTILAGVPMQRETNPLDLNVRQTELYGVPKHIGQQMGGTHSAFPSYSPVPTTAAQPAKTPHTYHFYHTYPPQEASDAKDCPSCLPSKDAQKKDQGLVENKSVGGDPSASEKSTTVKSTRSFAERIEQKGPKGPQL
jgi:hypothetical protein